MTTGHKQESAKMDCSLTPSDAHVLCGSEDGAPQDEQTHAPLELVAWCQCTNHVPFIIPSVQLSARLFTIPGLWMESL